MKTTELEDTESRTKTSDVKVKIQRRVFVMKFGKLIASATQMHAFDEVKSILDAAKNQPDAQSERHARYRSCRKSVGELPSIGNLATWQSMEHFNGGRTAEERQVCWGCNEDFTEGEDFGGSQVTTNE
ncbi:hypothetical protein R1sor_027588 [Riccia sorocarpa]|uniref:Uncharacterized protein n=1 Tax=Riccia sorocarpa TaxID=122646 RepID=A0ABD3GEL6_9MARC